jgi:hypothetical protein
VLIDGGNRNHFRSWFYIYLFNFITEMPLFNTPQYPVVDPDPSTSKAILNFNSCDIINMTGFGTFGYVFGYFTARKPFRQFNGRITCVIGLTGGLLYGIMRSTQRFAGLEANEAEVARYGAIPAAALAETESRRNIRNVNLIDTNAIDIAKRAEK